MRKSRSVKRLAQEDILLLLDSCSNASIQSTTGTRSLRKDRQVSSTGDLKKKGQRRETKKNLRDLKERRNKSFQELGG
jgi:hypothetical protein